MKKIIPFFLVLFFAATAFAQDKKSESPWKPDVAVSFGLGQIGYSNWAKGGENQLSWSFNFVGNLVYETPKVKWTNAMKIDYGRNQVGSGTNKVTQNDLLFNSMFSLKSDWALDYYAGVNLITQIAPGYNYEATPEVQVNSLFDPADVTESVGLIYAYKDVFKSQLGFGFHQVFAGSFYEKTDDPGTLEIEKSIYETGIESITTAKLDFAENLSWVTYLRLFSAFDRLDTWDVRWDNTLVGKINSWLNATFTWIVVYDVKETLKTQVKEGLQIGISYKLL